MSGTEVFVIPKGEKLPPYKEPNDKLPNGDSVYAKYHRAWFMALGNKCEC